MKCREVFLSVDANADFKAGREFYDLNSKKLGIILSPAFWQILNL